MADAMHFDEYAFGPDLPVSYMCALVNDLFYSTR